MDQGILNKNHKVAQNEKRKKLHGFYYSKDMACFEPFAGAKTLTKVLLFLRSEHFVKPNITYSLNSMYVSRLARRYFEFRLILPVTNQNITPIIYYLALSLLL